MGGSEGYPEKTIRQKSHILVNERDIFLSDNEKRCDMVLLVAYESIEFWLEIPKLIEIGFFWFLAVRIYNLKKTDLNKLFMIAFLTWSIYTICDLIMWITAANSPTWFIIDNRLRDLQLISAYAFSYMIFYASQLIKSGKKGIKKNMMLIIAGIYLMCAIAFVATDELEITDGVGNVLDPNVWATAPVIVVSPNISLISALFMAIPLILYGVSVATLIRVINQIDDDPALRKRMIYLIIGICLIPLGIIYFAIVLSDPSLYNFWVAFIGRMIWAFSPVFVWRSQKKSD